MERWRPQIAAMWKRGLQPTAIHELMEEQTPGFDGSLSAAKRMVARLKKERGAGQEGHGDSRVNLSVHSLGVPSVRFVTARRRIVSSAGTVPG